MRAIATRVLCGLAVAAVMAAAGPGLRAEEPPPSPFDPPEARIKPPSGVASQSRIKPPSGDPIAEARIKPPGGRPGPTSRIKPPSGEPDAGLLDLLLDWLCEQASRQPGS